MQDILMFTVVQELKDYDYEIKCIGKNYFNGNTPSK